MRLRIGWAGTPAFLVAEADVAQKVDIGAGVDLAHTARRNVWNKKRCGLPSCPWTASGGTLAENFLPVDSRVVWRTVPFGPTCSTSARSRTARPYSAGNKPTHVLNLPLERSRLSKAKAWSDWTLPATCNWAMSPPLSHERIQTPFSRETGETAVGEGKWVVDRYPRWGRVAPKLRGEERGENADYHL